MVIPAIFTITKLWNQLRCPLMDDQRKCDVDTLWSFIQPLRRMKLCHLLENGCNQTPSY
jgi:hypothetical protein